MLLAMGLVQAEPVQEQQVLPLHRHWRFQQQLVAILLVEQASALAREVPSRRYLQRPHQQELASAARRQSPPYPANRFLPVLVPVLAVVPELEVAEPVEQLLVLEELVLVEARLPVQCHQTMLQPFVPFPTAQEFSLG